MEYQPKADEKYMPFLHCISSVVGTFYKNLWDTHQIIYLLLFYISFYISRYYFWQIFRSSFNILKKYSHYTKYPYLTDSLKPLHLLNNQNLLNVTKV